MRANGRKVMLDRGFFGREAELARAANWLSHPQHAVGRSPPCSSTGFRGSASRRSSTRSLGAPATSIPPWIVVRLDFDRGGLDIQDRVGLTLEITRQIAWELGEDAAALRSARLVAAGTGSTSYPNVKGGPGRARIPDELTRVLGEALRASGRKVLLVLDTVEVLRGHGETHPQRLFETLDELCERGASARCRSWLQDEASRSTSSRSASASGSSWADSTTTAPTACSVDSTSSPRRIPRIREVSDGIPLVLRLGALAVQESGVAALDGVTGRRELAATYLYRFLLSRIDDDNAPLAGAARPHRAPDQPRPDRRGAGAADGPEGT